MTDKNEELIAKISKNYDKFVGLCKQLGDRSAPVMEMIDALGDRLAMAPASSRLEYHNAFPGGLVEHSLRVLTLTFKLMKAYDLDFQKDSLVISTLFHDLGKVGNLTEDHYINEDSQWHRDRGKMYTYNPKLQYMSTAHRGLWLLQHFGVKLNEAEYLAIMLNDGPEAEENRIYSMKEPTLAVIVHQADRMACEFEKTIAVSEKA